MNTGPLATGVQPVAPRPPRRPSNYTGARKEEIGAEYDIPRAIRQQFTNWPAELKKLPARTTLYVIEVGERPVPYTLSGWDETFKLMWIINGQKHYMEVPWYHFLHPLIKGEPYNIKRHRTAMPALVQDSNTQLTTAGCGWKTSMDFMSMEVEYLRDEESRPLMDRPALVARLHAAGIYTDKDFMQVQDWSTIFFGAKIRMDA